MGVAGIIFILRYEADNFIYYIIYIYIYNLYFIFIIYFISGAL